MIKVVIKSGISAALYDSGALRLNLNTALQVYPQENRSKFIEMSIAYITPDIHVPLFNETRNSWPDGRHGMRPFLHRG